MARMKERTSRSLNAERLKRLRRMLDMSQRKMADEFMVTSAAVALWETAARAIPGPVLKLIEMYEAELGIVDEDKLRGDSNEVFDKIATSWIRRNAKLSRTLVG